MPASSEINVINSVNVLTLCIMMHFSSLGVHLNFSLCNNLTMGKNYKFTKWATDSDHRKQTTGVKTPLNS